MSNPEVRKIIDTLPHGYQVICDAMEEDNVPWKDVLLYSDALPKHGAFKIACVGWALAHKRDSIVNIAIDLWHDSVVSMLCIYFLTSKNIYNYSNDYPDGSTCIDVNIRIQLCKDIRNIFLEIMEKIIGESTPAIMVDIRNIVNTPRDEIIFNQPAPEQNDIIYSMSNDKTSSIRNMYHVIHNNAIDGSMHKNVWAYRAVYMFVSDNPLLGGSINVNNIFLMLNKMVITNILSEGNTSITSHTVGSTRVRTVIVPQRKVMDERLNDDVILRAVQTTIAKYINPSVSISVLNRILNIDTIVHTQGTTPRNIRPMTTNGLKYK